LEPNVLILGSAGMAGHQVYNYLEENCDYSLSSVSHRRKLRDDTILVNIRNENKFLDTVKQIAPDIIVNCIGVLISESHSNPGNAIFINAYMPHRLAELADQISAKVIHISTDCVFSGSKKEPYIETDEKDGKDLYAKSKALGEIVNDKHLTFRTSIVGPELKTDGQSLFHWFMNQSGTIEGFTKAIWSGVTTLELAKAIKWAIEYNITGLYHVTNSQSISKYDLLQLFKKYTDKDIEISETTGNNIDKSFIDTRKEMNYTIPTYDDMIKDMVKLIAGNQQYLQYGIEGRS
jgi:dTDP-4-dehydrorhamnose reductase